MRRLWPWIIKGLDLKRKSYLSAVLLCSTAFCVGLAFKNPWFSVLFMSLPWVWTCFKFPGLTDQPAMLCFALALCTGRWEYAAIGALFNEKSAIFGSLFCSPLCLVGLVVPGLLYLKGEKATLTDPDWLQTPVKAALKPARFADARYWLLPWGTALTGLYGLQNPIALAVGYLQLLAAQDGPRLYMWAFPCLFAGIPLSWLPIVAVLNWANPYRNTV